MPKIIPTILVNTFADFEKQLTKIEGLSDIVQIDIMDGDFVPYQSFEDIEKINNIKTSARFELHLMVQTPLIEMEKWTKINNVMRVVFHVESKDDPAVCVDFARQNGWYVGLALNPETALFVAEPYYGLVDEIMFLTVYPGRMGAPFIPEVKDKIKEFTAIPNRPLCAVDGGVKTTNIAELKKLGVDIFCIGSAISMAPDPKAAYNELTKLCIV